MIRIAIIGAGFIGAIHARAVIQNPSAQLVAVVDVDNTNRRKAFAEAYGISEEYSSIEDLNNQSVDAVVICTPNYLHAPQTEVALKAGMHVLVEKPMALHVQEAEQMDALSRAVGKTLMIANCWRYDHEVLWLKDQIYQKSIGSITRTKSYGIHENWGPSGWFVQKELAGGGALMDLGIHAIDTTRFLLGDPQPESVYALLNTNYGNYDVDDTGMILIKWENGISSFIETGWWQPYKDAPEAATQVFGTNGYGSVFPTFIRTLDKSDQQKIIAEIHCEYSREEHAEQSMYNRQMDHFVSSIQNQTSPCSNSTQGIINMKILEAAYQSNSSGQAVKL
ncbi:MAG TPA: Gfo/Idh/MocA family oxidoreductase [Anaerolineaceae bacterium]|nr:Gfo/Idh/MocA family oxidoreductase [Anaerolineaceae bacterium]